MIHHKYLERFQPGANLTLSEKLDFDYFNDYLDTIHWLNSLEPEPTEAITHLTIGYKLYCAQQGADMPREFTLRINHPPRGCAQLIFSFTMARGTEDSLASVREYNDTLVSAATKALMAIGHNPSVKMLAMINKDGVHHA